VVVGVETLLRRGNFNRKEKLEGLGLLARRVQGSGGEASGGSIKSGRNALVDGTGRFRE
jgi:hypothetical protein